MKNILVACLLCINVFAVHAQSKIIVEKVILTETVDNNYKSEIPRVKDAANPKSKVVEKINEAILDRFMIESFNQKELEEFRWYEVSFNSEVKSDVLYIAFAGEYYGAYPNYVEEKLYFDLKTGELLENEDIPFHALFHLNGYLDFLNKYWIKEAENAFQEAMECSEGIEPHCSYYNIDYYTCSKKEFFFELTSDCYPRVLRACSPVPSMTVPTDAVKPYLSALGKKALLEDGYTEMGGVDRYLYNKKHSSALPDNIYLFGKVAGKYPFSMALTLNKATGAIHGYYFYDKKQVKLVLTGELKGAKALLTETVNGKITGYFELDWETAPNGTSFNWKGNYPKATWMDASRVKKLQVTFNSQV